MPYRSGAGTRKGDGCVCRDCSRLRLASGLHDSDGSEVAHERPTAALIVPLSEWLLSRFGPEKFVAILGRLSWSETVAALVFGHHARHEKLQKIIFAAGLGAAAAHLKSTKGVTPDDRTRARAVDVNVSGFTSRFDALDVIAAAREKAAVQRVFGSIRNFKRS